MHSHWSKGKIKYICLKTSRQELSTANIYIQQFTFQNGVLSQPKNFQ